MNSNRTKLEEASNIDAKFTAFFLLMGYLRRKELDGDRKLQQKSMKTDPAKA